MREHLRYFFVITCVLVLSACGYNSQNNNSSFKDTGHSKTNDSFFVNANYYYSVTFSDAYNNALKKLNPVKGKMILISKRSSCHIIGSQELRSNSAYFKVVSEKEFRAELAKSLSWKQKQINEYIATVKDSTIKGNYSDRWTYKAIDNLYISSTIGEIVDNPDYKIKVTCVGYPKY